MYRASLRIDIGVHYLQYIILIHVMSVSSLFKYLITRSVAYVVTVPSRSSYQRNNIPGTIINTLLTYAVLARRLVDTSGLFPVPIYTLHIDP